MTENEFIEKYSDIVTRGSHSHNDYFSTTSDYRIEGILVGDVECSAIITVDSLSRHLKQLDFVFAGVFNDYDRDEVSQKMDGILYRLLGEPDVIKNELNSKYVQHKDREWFKENYTVSVSHMWFPEMKSNVYSIDVAGLIKKGPDFRHSNWGDSRETVKKAEGQKALIDDDKIYAFDGKIAGMDCLVGFIFTNNKLTMAKYIFNEKHTNKNDYIQDYHDLVTLMTKKYGEPKWDEPEWKNSLYRKDRDDYGFAISLGHLTYSAAWENDETRITVYLYGENYEITLGVQYVSKRLENLSENVRDKESLEML